MATASATLFFGIFVSTPSLIFAADAESLLEGPLKVIDLINIRQTSLSSRLVAGLEGICFRVPPEIWNQIRKELYLSAVKESERDFIDRCRCDEGDCESYGHECEACGQIHDYETVWKRWKVPICEYCSEEAREGLSSALHDSPRAERINRLLSKYKLKLLSRQQVRPETFEDDFISLSAITLEKNLAVKELEAATDPENEYPEPADSIANIPVSFLLQITKNQVQIKKRFDSLRKTYFIHARDPDNNEDSLAEEMDQLNLKRKKKKKRRVETGTRPRFLLWLTCDCDY